MTPISPYLSLLKQSLTIQIGVVLTVLCLAFSVWYFWDRDLYEILIEVRNLSTFLMVGWSLIRFLYNNEKTEITLTEGKFKDDNQTITVKRKQLRNISDITNIVSAKFYGGDKIEGTVRNQLFVFAELITEEEMRRLNG